MKKIKFPKIKPVGKIYKKNVIIIDSCNACSCRIEDYCNHELVHRIYERTYNKSNHTSDNRITIKFNDVDNEYIKKTGFPKWCPLENS